MEIGVDLHDPLGLPLPVTVDGEEDGVTRQFELAVLVAPIRPLVREQYVLENTHPNALILIRLKLAHIVFVVVILVFDVHGVSFVLRLPIPLLLFEVFVDISVGVEVLL